MDKAIVAQLVERGVANAKVEGSSPFVRSIMEDYIMSISFIVNNDFLMSSWYGHITDEIMIENFKTLISDDPDWVPGLNHIADMSEADLSDITGKGIKDLASLMRKNTINKTHHANQVAMIVKDEHNFRISEIYRSFFDIADRDIEIFKNVDSAIEWFKTGEYKL